MAPNHHHHHHAGHHQHHHHHTGHHLHGGLTIGQPIIRGPPPITLFPPGHPHHHPHHFRHHPHMHRSPDIVVVEQFGPPVVNQPYVYGGPQTVPYGYATASYNNFGRYVTYYERPNIYSECDCTDLICVSDGRVLAMFTVACAICCLLGIILMMSAFGNSGQIAAGLVFFLLGLIGVCVANGFQHCAYNKYGRAKREALFNQANNITEQDVEAVKNPVLPNVDLDTSRPFSSQPSPSVLVVNDAGGSNLAAAVTAPPVSVQPPPVYMSPIAPSAPPSVSVFPAGSGVLAPLYSGGYSAVPTAPYPIGVQSGVGPSVVTISETITEYDSDDGESAVISVSVTEEL